MPIGDTTEQGITFCGRYTQRVEGIYSMVEGKSLAEYFVLDSRWIPDIVTKQIIVIYMYKN